MVIGVKSPNPTTPSQNISAYCPVVSACFAASALAPPSKYSPKNKTAMRGISKSTALKSKTKRYFTLSSLRRCLKHKSPTKMFVATPELKPEVRNKIGRIGVFQSGSFVIALSKKPVYIPTPIARPKSAISTIFESGAKERINLEIGRKTARILYFSISSSKIITAKR